MNRVHKEAFSRQIATRTWDFRIFSHLDICPFPAQSCSNTGVYTKTSLKSSNSQCTVQIIHKLHLAPGNKQHHVVLSCFVAQSTSLPLAKEKSLSLCLVWLELASFQGSGSRSLIVSEECACPPKFFTVNEASNTSVYVKIPHYYMTTAWYKELWQ